MTPPRRKMIEEFQIRHYVAGTQKSYRPSTSQPARRRLHVMLAGCRLEHRPEVLKNPFIQVTARPSRFRVTANDPMTIGFKLTGQRRLDWRDEVTDLSMSLEGRLFLVERAISK